MKHLTDIHLTYPAATPVAVWCTSALRGNVEQSFDPRPALAGRRAG